MNQFIKLVLNNVSGYFGIDTYLGIIANLDAFITPRHGLGTTAKLYFGILILQDLQKFHQEKLPPSLQFPLWFPPLARMRSTEKMRSRRLTSLISSPQTIGVTGELHGVTESGEFCIVNYGKFISSSRTSLPRFVE